MKINKPGEEEREVIVVPIEEPIYSPVPDRVTTDSYSKTLT